MHDAYHIHGIHAPVHARRDDYAQILTWMLNYAPVTDNEDYARNYAGIIRRSLVLACLHACLRACVLACVCVLQNLAYFVSFGSFKVMKHI